MRILLGADFHLGARQNYLGPQASTRREDLHRALVRFVDYALDPSHSIDLVLLLGDLFDHHAPPPAVRDPALAQLSRLLASGMPVAAVPGTHDGYGYPDSVYRSEGWPGGVVLITSPAVSITTIEVGGQPVHLYGIAYDPGRTPPDPLGELRKNPDLNGGFHVGMVHGSVPASPEWEFRRRDLAVPTADLPASGLDLLAMGHYHNFMEKRFGPTAVVYPGTLEGLKFSETGLRRFIVVSLGADGVRIEGTPYPGREIIEETIDLDRIGSNPAFLEETILKLAGRDRIARVLLTGHMSSLFDAASLQEHLSGNFFHLSIDDATLKVDERWAARLAGEGTIRGLFVRKMNERLGKAPESERPAIEAALRAGLAEFGAGEAFHGD